MHWQFGADIFQSVVSCSKFMIFISVTVCIWLKLKMHVFWNGLPWFLKYSHPLGVISNPLCTLEWSIQFNTTQVEGY
jgi:hypothetical protein